jgi:hypothetical protein
MPDEASRAGQPHALRRPAAARGCVDRTAKNEQQIGCPAVGRSNPGTTWKLIRRRAADRSDDLLVIVKGAKAKQAMEIIKGVQRPSSGSSGRRGCCVGWSHILLAELGGDLLVAPA